MDAEKGHVSFAPNSLNHAKRHCRVLFLRASREMNNFVKQRF